MNMRKDACLHCTYIYIDLETALRMQGRAAAGFPMVPATR